MRLYVMFNLVVNVLGARSRNRIDCVADGGNTGLRLLSTSRLHCRFLASMVLVIDSANTRDDLVGFHHAFIDCFAGSGLYRLLAKKSFRISDPLEGTRRV